MQKSVKKSPLVLVGLAITWMIEMITSDDEITDIAILKPVIPVLQEYLKDF